MSQNGKYYPDTVLKSGDEIQISFAFQGEKEISGIVKKVEVIANALVAVVEVSGRKYKTLSGEPLEYVLIKYPGEIFYFLVKDGAIRSVDFSILLHEKKTKKV